MLQKDTLIKVKNRAYSRVGYQIPDLGNLCRNFMPEEEKEIPFEELRKLSFTPGGRVILEQYLVIENNEALKELIGKVEPEYFYDKEDIEKLLVSATIEEFMDFLNFAPSSAIDLLKNLAVKLELNDIRKRDAILKKTGFNVTKAIEIERETSDDNEEIEKKVRKAPMNSINQTKTTSATPSKYKITLK